MWDFASHPPSRAACSLGSTCRVQARDTHPTHLWYPALIPCYTFLGKTQLQKLAHEVRVPSRLYTSYYFGTQAMWDFASQLDMFGYATDETPERMPLSHVLATKLAACLAIVRKNGTCSWLRPDGKTQVTIEYFSDNGAMVPIWVHTVVISTRHDETVTKYKIEAGLMEHVIKHVIPRKYLDEKTIYHLNHSGLFVIGGPCSDAGVTGRKIVIDTYGGWGSHGGGAFFGKDPTKLDRSGAYLCRQVAKSIVNNRLARRCSVQVAYVPSVSEPSSLFVDAYGTGKIPHMEILKIVKENFDFRPGMIAIKLDLKRGGNGRFSKTAVYGHFGRDDPDFTWEVVKLLKMGETPSVKFLQFK